MFPYYGLLHVTWVKVEELRRYLRFWLIAERVPVSMRKTKQQWMCGDLVGKHVPEYADSRQSALQINVCQRSALEISPSQSLRNRRSKDRDLMCIASVRTSFSFFVDNHVDCWLCTVHIVHIASGHKSGSEVTWRSWSPDSQVFLRKLSDLRSLPQHCKILLDLEEFSSNQFLLVADNSGGCLQMQKRNFQSFKVLKMFKVSWPKH